MRARDRIKHVVVLCHPELDSFNAAVAARYCAEVEAHGQVALLRDLYRMGFDPVLRAAEQPGASFTLSPDIADELALIAGAAVLVLVYPIWFGTPPAMLKGYVDRVLGASFTAGEIRSRAAKSNFAGTHLLSFTSSGSSRVWLEEQGQRQSLLQVFDRYLARAFSMASVANVHFPAVSESMGDLGFRQSMDEVRQAAVQSSSVALDDLRRGQPAHLRMPLAGPATTLAE